MKIDGKTGATILFASAIAEEHTIWLKDELGSSSKEDEDLPFDDFWCRNFTNLSNAI